MSMRVNPSVLSLKLFNLSKLIRNKKKLNQNILLNINNMNNKLKIKNNSNIIQFLLKSLLKLKQNKLLKSLKSLKSKLKKSLKSKLKKSLKSKLKKSLKSKLKKSMKLRSNNK